MRDWFEALAAAVCVTVPALDRVSLSLEAEESDFLRFNHAKLRQGGQVQQRHGTVTVVAGRRRASATCTLTGDLAADTARLRAERDQLASELPLVPEDPFLLLPDVVQSTSHEAAGTLASAEEVVATIATEGAGADLVGFYAGGPVRRAYADSRGQRNWHAVGNFHFEWCLYREGDLAVKSTYAGMHWETAELARRMGEARAQLELLARPRKTLAPGRYRVLFSPVAVADLLGTLGWGGFGERGVRTGVSTLVRLQRGEELFAPSVRITEARAAAGVPAFQSDGFVNPAEIVLVDQGRAAGTLVSPRSASEYGLAASNSGDRESPEALALAPGALPAVDALKALGTGVYLSDLHYLNYSDRQACRVTGMTRFACMWVEDGRPVAPIAVMRFDDSLLRMFGSGLVALTDRVEFQADNATYGARQLRGTSAPGAIVDDFAFTL
ncbi:TldD/PmbA family protein [Ramlibacter sp. G-1-2-2]|uniref:TldD/PmbA family protein n=1 Tax=Ramlibacter agri TaxID=2728837 RepID=A0A848H8Y4_9BURK|nr:metallopeptidase TldD-related protein [Ramlibacter agri]NML45969.1 TldD/PmbA family protein [Ramlibacter agri]